MREAGGPPWNIADTIAKRASRALTAIAVLAALLLACPTADGGTKAAATGTIALAVDSAPDSSIAVTLMGPAPLGATVLDGSPGTSRPSARVVKNVPAGSFVVTQGAATGLALVQIACTDPDGGSTVKVGTRSATIDLDGGESVTCTFTSISTASSTTAAVGLQSLGFGPSEAAVILRQAGFSAQQTLAREKAVFGRKLEDAARDLLTAKYTAREIADALKLGEGKNAQETAAILQLIAVPVAVAATTLATVYAVATSGPIVSLLVHAGYAAATVAAIAVPVLGMTVAQAVVALQAAGVSVATIAALLKDPLGQSAATAAASLLAIGATSATIALALKDVFATSAATAAGVLLDIGFSATTVAKRLEDRFGKNSKSAAQILKSKGVSATAIAKAMKDAYAKNATQTVQILQDLGYSATTLVRVLDQVFGKSAAAIQPILLDLGFSAGQVAAAIAAALGG